MQARTFLSALLPASAGILLLCSCSSLNYGSYYEYELINQDEVAATATYTQENAPFTMVPELVHAPLLSQKGQMNVSFDAGNGYSGSVAYSISERAALMFSAGTGSYGTSNHDSAHIVANYQVYGDNPSQGSIDDTYGYSRINAIEAYFGEAAYGRFKVLNKALRHELFIGAGWGKTSNSWKLEADESYLNLSNSPMLGTYSDTRQHLSCFIQYGIGLVTKNVELSVAGRFNGFTCIERSAEVSNSQPIPGYSTTAYSFDPAVRLGFGGKSFRVFAQYTAALPIGKNDVTWAGPQFRGGIIFRVNDIY